MITIRRLAAAGSGTRLALAVLFAAAICVAGCGPKVARVAPVGPNDVIVAFGDSLTYGTGAAESESYPLYSRR